MKWYKCEDNSWIHINPFIKPLGLGLDVFQNFIRLHGLNSKILKKKFEIFM